MGDLRLVPRKPLPVDLVELRGCAARLDEGAATLMYRAASELLELRELLAARESKNGQLIADAYQAGHTAALEEFPNLENDDA